MTGSRRYDIDALRSLAFLLLIFYHVGMFYVADWNWHIKSVYQSDWLKFPMILVNQWRMPLLFLVSGIATGFLLRSFLLRKLGPLEFLKTRSARLLVPFAVGVIFIIPPQAWLQAQANGSIATHFGEMSYTGFLWHYFSFSGWPEGAFDGSEFGFTWNHLWFIPYLFVYTLLILALRFLLQAQTIEKFLNRTGVFPLVVIPVLIQILWQLTFDDDKPISHALIDDAYAHAMYFTFFVLGYLISDNSSIWQIIVKHRWFTLCTAFATYCSLLLLWMVFNQYEWQDHLEGVIATFNQWLWLLAVLGWSARLLNRPSTWIRFANSRVYPWYIFHQTITVVAGYTLAKFSLGAIVEPLLLTLFTIIGCLLCTELFIGKNKLLKTLFGMK